MPTNTAIGAFLERLKSIFAKKPSETEPASARPNEGKSADAVRGSSSTTSTTRLQAVPKQDSNPNIPAFKQGSQEQGYQASRGADQAARRPLRQSSTYVKLQALSASGTGSNSTPGSASPDDTGLNNILDRLDNKKK